MLTVTDMLKNPSEYHGKSIMIEGNIYRKFVQSKFSATYTLSSSMYISDEETMLNESTPAIMISHDFVDTVPPSLKHRSQVRNLYQEYAETHYDTGYMNASLLTIPEDKIETKANIFQRGGEEFFVSMLARIPRPETYLNNEANRQAPIPLRPIFRSVGSVKVAGTLATLQDIPEQYSLIDLTEAIFYSQNYTAWLDMNESPLSEILPPELPAKTELEGLTANIRSFIGKRVALYSRIRGLPNGNNPSFYMSGDSVFMKSTAIHLQESSLTEEIGTCLDIAVGGNIWYRGRAYVVGTIAESKGSEVDALAELIDIETIYISQQGIIFHWNLKG